MGTLRDRQEGTIMRVNYRTAALLFFLCGSVLRVLLCWSNPPGNAFDNHFQPIFMIMQSGAIPAKDACWQCYHPPVFYWASAMLGNMAVAAGVALPEIPKILQFLPCLYGILTLVILYFILGKLPLSGFSRLMAFGTLCFLPRHIYMSAMNSNDTISYLFVSLTIYSLLIAIERKLSPLFLLVTSGLLSIALFTKYTSYVVLPILLVAFCLLFYRRLVLPRKKVAVSFLFTLFIPVTLLSLYWISNVKSYGSPLPWNVRQLDPSLTQPRDADGLDLYSFKPWESITTPTIVPGKMHSLWTLLYTGMWFDNEPKFLYFLDSNQDWWKDYYAWLRGEKNFPGDNPSTSLLTRVAGSALVALGLLPLLLIILGLYTYFRKSVKPRTATEPMDGVKMSIFPVLLIANAAGVIALALRLPVYSAMKASYFLNSLPAFAVFLSLGLMRFEKNKTLNWTVLTVLVVLFAFATVHILHIVLSLRG